MNIQVGLRGERSGMVLNFVNIQVHPRRREVRDGALATFEAASQSWESQAGRRAGGERAQLANCHTSTSTSTSIHFYSASTLLLLLLLLHSYSALFSVQLNCWWLVWCTSMPLPLVISWCTGTGAWCTGASYWYLVHWRLVH